MSLVEIATKTDLPAEDEPVEDSEQDRWKIIQGKLAQQQALLWDRENDSGREENDDE